MDVKRGYDGRDKNGAPCPGSSNPNPNSSAREQLQVWFLEELGIFQLMVGSLLRRKVFFCRESVSIRVLKRFLRLRLPSGFKNIWFGDVRHAPGVRRLAYENARRKAEVILQHWSAPPLQLAIDYKLLYEKHVVEYCYAPDEFLRFAARYIEENPGNRYQVIVQAGTETPVELDRLGVPVQKITRFEWLQRLSATVLIGLHFGVLQIRQSKRHPGKVFANALLCEVNTPRVKHMYDEVFEGWSPQYLVAAPYRGYFADHQAEGAYLADRKTGRHLRALKKIAADIVRLMRYNASAQSGTAGDWFSFYKKLYDGLNRCPDATASVFVTYEHGCLANYARNEILKSWANVSVFLPYDVYVIDHYYVPEYRYNYDVLCSSGPLLERIYARQQCKTRHFLQIGAYWQAQVMQRERPVSREKILGDRGNTTVVTFLSTGIQDETINGESRLLDLAIKVSEIPGIRVVIRPKPQPPKPGYEDYLIEKFRGVRNVVLSSQENNLLSLLDFTDLFITGMSSSAVDLCICGGNFYSIDLWRDPDMYLWQTIESGVFIAEESALETISNWVSDANQTTRRAHAERMKRLRSHLSYPVMDVDHFRVNLQRHLAEVLQEFPAVAEIGRSRLDSTLGAQVSPRTEAGIVSGEQDFEKVGGSVL